MTKFKNILEGMISEILADREPMVGYRWKDFQKNYLKLNPKYTIIHDKKENVYYGLKKGTNIAHWKYFDDAGQLYIDDRMTARKVMTGRASKNIFEAFGFTGVPFPQETPNEFAYLDFKKYVYKNRGRIKSILSKAHDTKIFKAIEMIWVKWARANAKEWSNVRGNKFGRELVKMMWKDNLIFDGKSHRITKLQETGKGIWHNIRAKRARGEKPAKKGSKAYKSAEKAIKSLKEKAPPGMEDVVLALKKKSDVENPYAVAWAMYNKKKKKENLSECVIAHKVINGNVILAKNRDRAYDVKLTIVRELINDIEVVYIHDEDTDWSEGMNEFGIGIINSTLQGEYDEKEKKIVKKSGKPSKDGFKMRTALGYKKLSQVIKSIIEFTGFSTGKGTRSGEATGLNGHTFVANPKASFAIETTSVNPPSIQKLDRDKAHTRANHGRIYKDAGYQKGKNALSSRVREKESLAVLSKSTSPSDLLTRLSGYRTNDVRNNPYRNKDMVLSPTGADVLSTTGQLLMDLTNKSMIVRMDKTKSELLGVDDRTPEDYQPKIKLNVEYTIPHKVNEDYNLDAHPKLKWIRQPLKDIDPKVMKYLFKQYKAVYSAEEMQLSAYSAAELQSSYEVVMLIDADKDPMPDAFIFTRGKAIKLLATDNQSLSKRLVIRKVLAMLRQGFRLEASKKMETIMKAKGAPVIDDEKKVRSLVGSKFLKWLGDGYYERKLKKGGSVVKRMYGSA